VVEDAGMAARRAVLGGAAALLAAGAPAAQEAAYPSRPVRLIVALGAGGDVDLVTRVVGHRMAELLGQPLVVENRPGAGSLVGHEAAARAVPDGYTLIMSTISALTANLALYDRLPYDPVHDFVPVVYVGNAPGVLVVPPASPWQGAGGHRDGGEGPPWRVDLRLGRQWQPHAPHGRSVQAAEWHRPRSSAQRL
jgi:tripartite-type tricarboxylate transporter receptor subunit TctC